MMKAVEPTQVWPLSVEGYRALGEAGLVPKDTELLYGTVYRKMSKSPLHSTLVRRLLKLLAELSLPGRFVMSEQPITCDDSEPEPDIAVVRGRNEEFAADHPHSAELVIEVCVSGHDYDRFKLRAYARANVKEVWLILAPEKQIEVHLQSGGGEFAAPVIHGPGGSLKSTAVPEFILDDLDKFFGV